MRKAGETPLHIFSARRKGIEAVEKKTLHISTPRFGKQDVLLAILGRVGPRVGRSGAVCDRMNV